MAKTLTGAAAPKRKLLTQKIAWAKAFIDVMLEAVLRTGGRFRYLAAHALRGQPPRLHKNRQAIPVLGQDGEATTYVLGPSRGSRKRAARAATVAIVQTESLASRQVQEHRFGSTAWEPSRLPRVRRSASRRIAGRPGGQRITRVWIDEVA